MGFSTDALHIGQEPDPVTGAITPPIYQTSTYVQEELGKHRGYEYARTQNRTREGLERCVAALEKAKYGFAFGSGMGAITTLLHLVKAGEHVLAGHNMYGGTYRVMSLVFADHALQFSYADMSDPASVEKALRPETRMIFLETPTNPLMALTDLGAVAAIARKRGILTVVDNTFMSPYFQRPLEFGIDIVTHSTTKYLNGHSDMVGGLVLTSQDAVAERLTFLRNAMGTVPGPFDCWLALRGLKTLAVRMERHNQSALRIARWLTEQTKVRRVFYPGLPDHPQHELAKRQMTGFGGMISFDLGSLEAAARLLKTARLFSLAESLGGVESLISHPASMTHASVPKADREAMGLTDGLVRISVGLEDVEDLVADLETCLAAV
jgi:cystathionine beta-lyase/cystathionine gamma-synthase